MSTQYPRPGNSGENQRGGTFNRLPADFKMPSDRSTSLSEGGAVWESVLMAHDLDRDIQADLEGYYKKCLQDDPLSSEKLQRHSAAVFDIAKELIADTHGQYGDLEAAVYSPALYYGEWPKERQKGTAATVAIFDESDQARYVFTRNKVYRVQGEGRSVVEEIVAVRENGKKFAFHHYSCYLAPSTFYAEVRKVQNLAADYTRWYEDMELPLLLGISLDVIQYNFNDRFTLEEAPVVMPELIQDIEASRSVEDPFYVTIHGHTFSVNVTPGKNNKVLVSVEERKG